SSAGWLLWWMGLGAVLGQTEWRTWRYLGWVSKAQWQSQFGVTGQTALFSGTGQRIDNRKDERKHMKSQATKLCPAQQEAFDGLTRGLPVGNVLVLWGGTGTGKTVVLRELHRTLGGAFLNMKDFVDAMREQHPLALEETFGRLVMDALAAHEAVIVDDLHLLANVVGGCGAYPRSNFLDAPLVVLATYAAEAGKKLIFGTEDQAPGPIQERSYAFGIREFQVADYEFLCHVYLGPTVARGLDYKKIHRFAPHLNAHQFKSSCSWCRSNERLDTDSFIEYLRSQQMASNVDLREVRAVDLHDLKGVDDVIESLEANMVLPLENDELATELNLKPKRGVLLVGPPGTGKTTVGRALAHRLKSKFFLVDGTFISGTGGFYGAIHRVFQAAKDNEPSIIFIDDSDAIFESGEELGLYRYLLTMLDGLESESAERVCVMMTAMDVGHLPPALLRSGCIELWLEMRLPDEEARTVILREYLAALPPAIADVDLASVVAATEGFTGADLKRLVEDGKTLFAYDKARHRPLRSPTEYCLGAVETVRANKERYAAAEAHARQQRPQRPSFYDMIGDPFGDVTED
ncbi:MAG TPA: ATP-binding protein, partial [Abditibacteriaceae bacterium]|nr:ATP-binding protein [Abditibacteriaceae bacterium]